MSSVVLRLAIKSLRFRKFSVSLTVFSVAISILLFLAVDTIRVQAKDNFVNTVSGIDLIVGSRSGSVQLLLYSIFHIGNATNNVSWDSYQKITKHSSIDWSIPISLGDSHKGFRVIGTNENFLNHYQYKNNRNLSLISGKKFSNLFDAVIGSNVAKKLNYTLNEEIILAHGMGNVSLTNHTNMPFTISGILESTGSPIDDSIIIDLKALEAIHIGWEHGIASKPGLSAEDIDSYSLQPKSITAFLIKLKSKHDVFNIQRAINDYRKEPLLAILPGVALLELWKVVGTIEKVLIIISGFVIVTALLSMLAIILTNLSSRRRELAVLRSVGASPLRISLLMIIETELLIIFSMILAIGMLYLSIIVFAPILHQSYGIAITLTPLSSFQWLLLASILIAGLVISLIPAFNAYRNTLQDGLTIRS
ncbi:MAG: ABC transporter permease [Gammaproteobacteria bacterium]